MDLDRREHDRRERDRENTDLRHEIRSLRNVVFRDEDTGADGLVTRMARVEARDQVDRWLLRVFAAIVLADAAGVPVNALLTNLFGG